MSDKPENAETPENTEKPVKTAAKPGPKPGSKPPGSKTAGKKPGSKPPASKTTGSKTAGTKTAGTKTGTSQPKSTNTTETEEQEPIQFIIQKVSPVFLVASGVPDMCLICQSLFAFPCAECEVKGITDACPTVRGRCGHEYHLHCIEKWVSRNPTCPLCQDHWTPLDDA